MSEVFGLLIKSRQSLFGSQVEAVTNDHDDELKKVLSFLVTLEDLQLLEVQFGTPVIFFLFKFLCRISHTFGLNRFCRSSRNLTRELKFPLVIYFCISLGI